MGILVGILAEIDVWNFGRDCGELVILILKMWIVMGNVENNNGMNVFFYINIIGNNEIVIIEYF